MCAMDPVVEAEPATSEATPTTRPPCFLCERQVGRCDGQDEAEEGLAECRNALEASGKLLVNGDGKEGRDQLLQKVFSVKVSLESTICEPCGYHLRLFKPDESIESAEICHEKCNWNQVIRALPHIKDEDNVNADPNSYSNTIFHLVKRRLHHQSLVELKAKALPENLELPIKSLNQLSTFLKSRISLTPDPRIMTPPLNTSLIINVDSQDKPKKRGRPRKIIDPNAAPRPQPTPDQTDRVSRNNDSDDSSEDPFPKPKKRGRPRKIVDPNAEPRPQSTPVQPDRVSRETSRLLELDSSFLDIIMTHPEGYSPRSILFTPERSVNRSSVLRSVTFSANNTFIEPLQFDDDDSDVSSVDSRECSRSPGSPVPKKRRIENEPHPKKLASPNKSPSKVSSSSSPEHPKTKKTYKKKSTEDKKSNGSPKDSKSNGSPKDKKSINDSTKDKKANEKDKKTAKGNSPEIKFKLSSLLLGLAKAKKKHQPQLKRLQYSYLKKKFGSRMLSCKVVVEREADPTMSLKPLRFIESLAESTAMDQEVEMICQAEDEKNIHKAGPKSPHPKKLPTINSNSKSPSSAKRNSITIPSPPSALKPLNENNPSSPADANQPPPPTNGDSTTTPTPTPINEDQPLNGTTKSSPSKITRIASSSSTESNPTEITNGQAICS